LAGQCGRLKCCLNFELDMYLEATEAFPKAKIVKIDTVTGVAYAKKTDILKQLIWFSYDDNPTWVPLPVALVNECMESNKNGIQSATLTDLAPANEILDKIIADEKANGFIDNAELLKDNEFEGLKKLDLKGPRNNNNNRNRNNNNKREGGNAPQNRPNNNRPGFNNNKPNNNKPNNNRPANNNTAAPNVEGSVVNSPKPNNPNPQNPNQPNRNPNKFKKPYNKNRGPRNNDGGNNTGGNTPPSAPPQS